MFKLVKSLAKDCTYEECKTGILNHPTPVPTNFAQRFKLISGVPIKVTNLLLRSYPDLEPEPISVSRKNSNEAFLDQLLAGLKDQKVVS